MFGFVEQEAAGIDPPLVYLKTGKQSSAGEEEIEAWGNREQKSTRSCA
jgi:hypothetical protein